MNIRFVILISGFFLFMALATAGEGPSETVGQQEIKQPQKTTLMQAIFNPDRISNKLSYEGYKQKVDDMKTKSGYPRLLEVDVVLDGNRQGPIAPFGGDAADLAFGTTFSFVGYMYPGGTLEERGLTSGINPDGTPEFPELVIGIWTVHGWIVDNSPDINILLESRQSFNFGETLGEGVEVTGARTIITAGLDPVEGYRAIIGGTGQYRYARGQVLEFLHLEPNATLASNFSMTFSIPLRPAFKQ